MTSLALALLIPVVAPAGVSAAHTERAFRRGWLPLLDALAESPDVRVSMHWSGPLLQWLEARAPAHLDLLVQLVRDNRVEAVGGPWASGLLPAIPERDASAQVQALQRWWREHVGTTPRGAWLPHHAWDPSAPRVLGRLGVQYTVLQDTQLAPAPVPEAYALTEREGTRLAVFAADTRISSMLPTQSPARVLRAIAARGAEGRRCVVAVFPPEALAAEDGVSLFGPRGWGRRWFGALTDASHWLKQVDFATVIERMPPNGRVYPPASIGLPPSPGAFGPGWDWTLAAHPEVDRLHKRMLRVSDEVLRLRNALRTAAPDDPRLGMLESATQALWSGQDAAAYVVNAPVGAQEPRVRHAAWSALLRAEHLVASSLGEAGRIRCGQVDDDCDGQSEIEVRARVMRGVVAPAHGGALVELDAWHVPANLLNVRTRREEAVHARTDADEDAAMSDAHITRPHARVAEAWFDRHLRGSFVDHFLPEDLGPDALVGRWAEAGDFVGRAYQLLHLDDQTTGPLVIGLGREGNVTEGTALRLVRVLKRYAFERDVPRVIVRYEVVNRLREPLRTRFGVEVNIGLDGMPPETSLALDGRRVAVGLPAVATGVQTASWVDGARDLAVSLTLPPDTTLWHAALQTHSRVPGGMAGIVQGVCALAVVPLELAPEGRARFEFALELA